MALPVQAPIKPMLAKPAKAIPDTGGLLFEPKWDGFRCLVFRDGDEITLQSRAEKPLNRYFPEVLAALRNPCRSGSCSTANWWWPATASSISTR